MKLLQDKVSVITGAGSETGMAIAGLFASEGARLVLVDTERDLLDRALQQILDSGGIAVGRLCDVSDEKEVRKLAEFTVKSMGNIGILINHTELNWDFLKFSEEDPALWKKVMGLNIDGPFFTCREFLPSMLENEKGVIINISSSSEFLGAREKMVYAASRHALLGLTKNIAGLHSNNGIRCNLISPGRIIKEESLTGRAPAEGSESFALMLRPGEIAQIALYLSCGSNSYSNGAVISSSVALLSN